MIQEHHTAGRQRKLTAVDGVRAGIPIAVGYLPIAIAFGLLARSAGVAAEAAILMSLIVFAGASQFVGINLLALGTVYGEIVLTTFLLNLRHFLMSASLAHRLEEGTGRIWRAILSFGITDETFTVATLRDERELSPQFLAALNATAFVAWNAGTWVGLFLAEELPAALKVSMGIALYAMFVGLLVPAVKKSRQALVVAVTAMAVNGLLQTVPAVAGLSAGWCLVIATLAGAVTGACLYQQKGEES